jgi:transcriptional regulator with XRE-family HTH domain
MDEMDGKLLAQFGRRIRERRIELSMSQEELAEKTNLHRNYVGAIERGERNISLLIFLRLARGLNMTPVALLQWLTDGMVRF